MIKAVTFDLWNTLFQNKFYSDERINLFIRTLKENNKILPEEDIKNGFQNVFYFRDINIEEIKFRHIYTEERLDRLLKFLKLDFNIETREYLVEQFESILLKNPPDLRKGVKKTLKFLNKNLNLKIGLISNTGITPGPVIREALKYHKILNYFDITSYSDEIGVYKPHEKIFRTTLQSINCKPENSIHIGDILETDIKGAKNLGMKTIWIKNEDHQNSSGIKPDFEITQIPEVIPIIEKLIT